MPWSHGTGYLNSEPFERTSKSLRFKCSLINPHCILASGILILTVQQFALQEIAEAYDVLSNAEKKLTYDRYGDVRGASGAFRRPSQSNGASYQEFRQFHTIDPFEIFRSFFGGTDPFRSDHFRQEFYNTIP